MKLHRLTGCLGALLLLAGCGGGGGSPDPDYRLSFTPSTLSASLIQGTPQSLSIEASLDRTVAGTVNAAVIDGAGVLSPALGLVAVSPTRYTATLTTAASLAVGRHTGNLQVRLCLDTPTVCNSPLPGSPFLLPYDFTVAPAPIKPAGVFSTAPVNVKAYLDELPSIQVNATTDAVGPVYPQIVGPAGVFQVNPPSVIGGNAISTTLFIDPTLAAGSHRGNLELRVCKDLPCSQQVPGSPVLLPYVLELMPSSNLTPLARWASVPEWAQHQANAAHTGYVPVTLDASKFTRRWRWTVPGASGTAGGTIQPVVTSAGAVYAVTSGYFQTASVLALAEADKTLIWQHDFGSIFAANAPATDGGRLFLATSGHEDTFMWAFDAAAGKLHFRTAFSSQWEHYLAPTIANGAVYTDGGYYGGMLSFKIADGTQNWFTALEQYDQWTPAVNGTHALAFMPSGLNALDVATGAKAFTIADPSNTVQPYSVYGAPMIIGPGNVVVINGPANGSGLNRLVNFDLVQRSVKWSIPGSFRQAPATAAGTIYTLNGAQLEARSAADGSRLWAWLPDEATTDPFPADYGVAAANLIVTDNLVFVCSATQVYAVSLGTHKPVWSYPVRATALALSPSGVLYITTSASAAPNSAGAALIAINLQ